MTDSPLIEINYLKKLLNRIDLMTTSEAVCWTILAAKSFSLPISKDSCILAIRKFISKDGRIMTRTDAPASWWTSSLAVLAYHGIDSKIMTDASTFLLQSGGEALYHQPEYDPIVGHDMSLVGWSWIENTHSWVVPTSYALLALNAVALKEHPRIDEARRLLLNRQLPNGGWNYGNTRIFDKVLKPLPECTGLALEALSISQQNIDKSMMQRIHKSIHWLKNKMPSLQTPLALSHSIFGLSSWNMEMDYSVNFKVCHEKYSQAILENPSYLGMLLVAKYSGTLSRAATRQPNLI